MARSEPHEIVRDLLRLRRWAVGVLSASENIDATGIEGISAETWRLFLSLERCAAILLDRITQPDATLVPGDIGLAALRKVSATESQTFLSAKIEGRELAAIARRVSWPVIVLKGGVGAMSGIGPTVPVGDIDVLVPPEHVADMVQVLATAGFGAPTRDLDHHHALSPATDRLAVEVHWTTHDDGHPLEADVWTRTREMSSVSPLQSLAEVDHLVHLVEHAVDTHRERSVSLRDIVLIADSAARCTPEEIEDARKRLAWSKAMPELLGFAIAMRSNPSGADPFFIGCASFYSAVVLADDLPRALSSQGALAFVTALDLGRVPRGGTFNRTLKWRGTSVERLSAITEKFPAIGKIFIAPARLAYYSLVAAITIPVIRRTRNKALTSLAMQTH